MFLQEIKKSTLSNFDDKRSYIKNIEKYTMELKILNGCKSKRKNWKDWTC